MLAAEHEMLALQQLALESFYVGFLFLNFFPLLDGGFESDVGGEPFGG
jgi:hypothetical protein